MGVFVIILIVIGVGYYHHRKKENEAAAIRRQQIEQSVRTSGDVNRMLSELRGFVRSMNQINQADNDTCVISISLIHQDDFYEYRNYQLKMAIEEAYTSPLHDIAHSVSITSGDTAPLCFKPEWVSKEDWEKYEAGDTTTKINILQTCCYQMFYTILFNTVVTDVKLYFPRGWIDSYELEISDYPYGTIDLTCTLQIPRVGSAYALEYVASLLRNEFPQNRFNVYDAGYGIYIG